MAQNPLQPDWELHGNIDEITRQLTNFKFKTFQFRGPGFYMFKSQDTVLIFPDHKDQNYHCLVYNSRNIYPLFEEIFCLGHFSEHNS